MTYSIVTAANRSYFPFLEILIKSANLHCKNLENIFVIDCGLNEFRSKVFEFPRVKIIDTNFYDNYSGVHSRGWQQATRSKTLGLLQLYQTHNLEHPLILIDSDVAILQDIESAIDTQYDIQATVMDGGGHARTDTIFIREIASFVCFNNHEVAKKFIKQWSDTITYLEDNNIDIPHETPSFNFTLRDFENDYKIGSLDENFVCADLKIFKESLSVHFKSNGGTRLDASTNFLTRIKSAKNFSGINHNFLNYLDKTVFNSWLMTMVVKNNRTLNLQEFKLFLDNLNENGEFSFGFNWVDYVKKTLSHSIIDIHCRDLAKIYQEIGLDINGFDVFDIGSGSGISSVSLLKCGAKSVHSIDIDPYSIEATNLTKQKFGIEGRAWTIEQQNIFDYTGPTYDLVYSWGVLHHTGDMWRAIDIAQRAVAVGGYLHIALYRSGPKYAEHLAQKQKFASLSRDEKVKHLYECTGGSPHMFRTDNRGMNLFHDTLDWLGGLPYEVCDPGELVSRLPDFTRVYFKDGDEGGNFVAVFKRNQ